ncbi:MAG: LLM class flavin-dependent oxidoreductase [Chloroflexota bacterium]
MSRPSRMRFGMFLAPFHRVGENPTLAIERDLELVQWLDQLGYDEAWVGEHHSAGWETIASPELFLAFAAERTRHIKLGTGVVSLPYHHPLMVANRMVQLDHMTRGRVLFGVGPGALVTDALMLGIDPPLQRPRMAESLDVIMRLMTDPTPLTYKSDWFELRDATLQLRPFTQPHMPLSVASMESPAGMIAAGKHGAGVLSLGVISGQRGQVNLASQWRIAEEEAAKHGKTMRREDWSLVVAVHLAETREEAIADVRVGAPQFQIEYPGQTLGRIHPLANDPDALLQSMRDSRAWVIGSPDDLIETIEYFQEITGGFGGFLIQAQDWAPREKLLKSYELLARYVMPRFQGSLVGIQQSQAWAAVHSATVQQSRSAALESAHRAYEQRGDSTVVR